MVSEEYETPVNFGDNGLPCPKAATATSCGSLGSSSREIKTPASAPSQFLRGKKKSTSFETDTVDARGGSLGSTRQSHGSNKRNNHCKIGGVNDGQSIHSSPSLGNNSSQRIHPKTKLERNLQYRAHRTNPTPQYLASFNRDKVCENSESNQRKNEDPMSKALTDFLFRTAVLGIDTTAKLTGPTLALTKNTLLPQIILPLIHELWEQYAPIRLQTWMKVLPSSLKNTGTLLWNTDAGKMFGTKLNQLGEDVLDMASSNIARQCLIDFTVILIKIMESLHTPEAKSLLDQVAVVMCRLVDMLSSGKAKQVWYDLADTLWAVIEVGSDPLVVTSLAEGCAQICFALEEERGNLKHRRSKNDTATKRRERDQRQRETYPPGKEILREDGGRDEIEKAFLASLGDKNCPYTDNTLHDEGNIAGELNITDFSSRINFPVSSLTDDYESKIDQIEVLGPIVSMDQEGDGESEITTEIEELQLDSHKSHEIHVKEIYDEKVENIIAGKVTPQLIYEHCDESYHYQAEKHCEEDLHSDNDAASELYDCFNESILQFYRRLNEVLTETRSESRLIDSTFLQDSIGGKAVSAHKSPVIIQKNIMETPVKQDGSILPTIFSSFFECWGKFLIIAASIMVAIIMFWFVLGCYGFYVLFLGGGGHLIQMKSAHTSLPDLAMQQPPNIIIQVIMGQGKVISDNTGQSCINNLCLEGENNDLITSITLHDWERLKLDVDDAIAQTTNDGDENSIQ